MSFWLFYSLLVLSLSLALSHARSLALFLSRYVAFAFICPWGKWLSLLLSFYFSFYFIFVQFGSLLRAVLHRWLFCQSSFPILIKIIASQFHYIKIIIEIVFICVCVRQERWRRCDVRCRVPIVQCTSIKCASFYKCGGVWLCIDISFVNWRCVCVCVFCLGCSCRNVILWTDGRTNQPTLISIYTFICYPMPYPDTHTQHTHTLHHRDSIERQNELSPNTTNSNERKKERMTKLKKRKTEAEAKKKKNYETCQSRNDRKDTKR